MSLWLNRASGQTAASTTQTATFTAATASSLLVWIIGGGSTHTQPTGWTERLQPVDYTELSVMTTVAAGGETSVSTTGSGADVQVWVMYEFQAGSTWSGTAGGTAATSTQPTATSLPGTAVTVFGAFSTTVINGTQNPSAVWTGSYVEDLDVGVTTSDFTYVTVGYQDAITATSATPTVTLTNTQAAGRLNGVGERVTFAIAVATAGLPPGGVNVVSQAITRASYY
jgi:hypothetical protein